MSKILDLIYRIRGETAPLDDLKGSLEGVQKTTQELGTDAGAWGEETKDAVEELQIPTRALSQLLRAVGADGAASFVQIAGNAKQLKPMLDGLIASVGGLEAALGPLALALAGVAAGYVAVNALAEEQKRATEEGAEAARTHTNLLHGRASAIYEETEAIGASTAALKAWGERYQGLADMQAKITLEQLKRQEALAYLAKDESELERLRREIALREGNNAEIQRTIDFLEGIRSKYDGQVWHVRVDVNTPEGFGITSGGPQPTSAGTISAFGQVFHDAYWKDGVLIVRGQPYNS